MQLQTLSFKKTLNLAYRLLKPCRAEIDLFKSTLIRILFVYRLRLFYLVKKSVYSLITMLFFLTCFTTSCLNIYENQYNSKNVDISYLNGFWQNIDDENDYLLFGYALNDNNTTKGFFGAVDLAGAGDEGKQKKYYAGGFELTKTEINIYYNEHNSSKPRITGQLFILGKDEIELPFGIYTRIPFEKAKEISGNPDFDK